ncbi:MAG TPA: ABC transporter transmembrane domain-containing protein, partial [Gaiellaceae bacterium]
MSTTERPEFVPAGAGLAATVAVETHGEIGAPETIQVRARGYWEQVWIRFRRDRVAIAGGVFIIFLIFAAFIGAPIAAHLLGHGPNDLFPAGGVDQTTLLPVGPWTHVTKAPYAGAGGHYGTTLFILGSDGITGRDEFLRILYGAQVSLEVAGIATILGMFVVMLYLDWKFTLIAMAVTPFLFLLVQRFTRLVKQSTRAVRAKESEIVSTVEESLGAIRVIQAFAQGDLEERKLARASEESVQAALQARRVKALLSPVMDLVASIGTA